jgi:hypothetical protein
MKKVHYEKEENVMLCSQCEDYLTETGNRATMEVQFPGYIWTLYIKTFQNLMQEKQLLWCIMPRVWMQWWQVAFDVGDLEMPPIQTEAINIIQQCF